MFWKGVKLGMDPQLFVLRRELSICLSINYFRGEVLTTVNERKQVMPLRNYYEKNLLFFAVFKKCVSNNILWLWKSQDWTQNSFLKMGIPYFVLGWKMGQMYKLYRRKSIDSTTWGMINWYIYNIRVYYIWRAHLKNSHNFFRYQAYPCCDGSTNFYVKKFARPIKTTFTTPLQYRLQTSVNQNLFVNCQIFVIFADFLWTRFQQTAFLTSPKLWVCGLEFFP